MIKIFIKEQTDITQAILEAGNFARDTGFELSEINKIKTIVSEMAYNIIKYAVRGEITIRRVKKNENKGLEIVSSDRGPGITDIQQALKDHFSTGKTLGLGLPSIKRMSNEFDLKTEIGNGTIVTSRVWL